MAVFHLQIVTPEKIAFDGEVQSLKVRTVTGDACIMARHIDYTAPLDIGAAEIRLESGETRQGACNSGLVSVHDGVVRLAAATFEWAEEIDKARAERAKAKAEDELKLLHKEDQKYIAMMSKLRRAKNRIDIAL